MAESSSLISTERRSCIAGLRADAGSWSAIDGCLGPGLLVTVLKQLMLLGGSLLLLQLCCVFGDDLAFNHILLGRKRRSDAC